MYERQFTRVDTIAKRLDALLNALPDLELRRNGYVHLYGVGQAGAGAGEGTGAIEALFKKLQSSGIMKATI